VAVISFPKIVADKMLEHAEENYYQVDVEDLFAHCYDDVYGNMDIRFYHHTPSYVANAPEVVAAFEEIERMQKESDMEGLN